MKIRSSVTVLVVTLTLFAVAMTPTLNAQLPPGPPIRFQFYGTLQPTPPSIYPFVVSGDLAGSLSAEFTGNLAIFAQPAETAALEPPNQCFKSPVTGTLVVQPPNAASTSPDVVLTIPGTLQPPGNPTAAAPSLCPAGPFTLDVNVFTGQTMITVNEATSSAPLEWTGTVILVMHVGANTVSG
jgi:hypothetical protein